MKTTIKVKVLTEGCLPTISSMGDWIDLYAAEDVTLKAPQTGSRKTVDKERVRNTVIPVTYIPLGVAIELPKGYEALINSRSGSPKKFNIFIPSGQGVVDNTYCGDEDEWKYVASPLDSTTIHKGDRICQFRIQLSQKATVWQKVKWLFSSGIKIVKVDDLDNNNRGMNVTGVK